MRRCKEESQGAEGRKGERLRNKEDVKVQGESQGLKEGKGLRNKEDVKGQGES